MAGVRLLALTHLSNRYFGGEILREARQAVEDAGGETHVVVPGDSISSKSASPSEAARSS